MNITPKTFRATADFTVGTESYAIGDVVPADSRHIERLIAYGYAAADGPKSKTPTTNEPKKEGSDDAAG